MGQSVGVKGFVTVTYVQLTMLDKTGAAGEGVDGDSVLLQLNKKATKKNNTKNNKFIFHPFSPFIN